MNETLQHAIKVKQEEAHLICEMVAIVASYSHLADVLSPTADFNFAGRSLWFLVYNREDLQVMMQLAPMWTKSSEGKAIVYSAEIHGISHQIRAFDAALPPTCKTIKVTETIPAQPEHVIEYEKIQCDV